MVKRTTKKPQGLHKNAGKNWKLAKRMGGASTAIAILWGIHSGVGASEKGAFTSEGDTTKALYQYSEDGDNPKLSKRGKATSYAINEIFGDEGSRDSLYMNAKPSPHFTEAFEALDSVDQKNIIDAVREFNAPSSFIEVVNGRETVSVENMGRLLEEYVVPEYLAEGESQENSMKWKFVLALMLGLLTAGLVRSYKKMDEKIEKTLLKDYVTRMKSFLEGLGTSQPIMAIMEAATFADVDTQAEAVKEEYNKAIEEIQENIKTIQEISNRVHNASSLEDIIAVMDGILPYMTEENPLDPEFTKTFKDNIIPLTKEIESLEKSTPSSLKVTISNIKESKKKGLEIARHLKKIENKKQELNKFTTSVMSRRDETEKSKVLGILNNAMNTMNQNIDTLGVEKEQEITNIHEAKKSLDNRATDKDVLLHKLFPKADKDDLNERISNIAPEIASLEDAIEEAEKAIETANTLNNALDRKIDHIKTVHGITQKDIEDSAILEGRKQNILNMKYKDGKFHEILTLSERGEYTTDNMEFLNDDGMVASFKTLNELSKKRYWIDEIHKLQEQKVEDDNNIADLKKEKKTLDEERTKILSKQNDIQEYNKHVATLRRAFGETIDTLSASGKANTIDDVYKVFVMKLHAIDPTRELPEIEGISLLNNTIHEMDTNQFLKGALSGTEAIGLTAGGYHMFRGILTMAYVWFASNTFVKALFTSTDTPAGFIPALTAVVLSLIGVTAYNKYYGKNMKHIVDNTLSGKASFRDMFLGNKWVLPSSGIALVLMMSLTDISGALTAWAGGVRKEQVAKNINNELNKFENARSAIYKYGDQVTQEAFDSTMLTILYEARGIGTDKGAGPITGEKTALTLGSNSEQYKIILDSIKASNLVPSQGFYNHGVPKDKQGQQVALEEEFHTSLQEARDSLGIIWNDEFVPMSQISRLIENESTGLLDVNAAKRIEEIKALLRASVHEFAEKVQSAYEERTCRLGELSTDLSTVGGAEIIYPKVDTALLNQNIDQLYESVEQLTQGMGKVSAYINPLDIKKVGETLDSLPLRKEIETIAWLLIMSLMLIHTAGAMSSRTKYKQNRKNLDRKGREKDKEKNEINYLKAKEAFDNIVNIALSMYREDSDEYNRLQRIATSQNPINTLLGISMEPLLTDADRPSSGSNRGRKKKLKERNAVRRARNEGEVNRNESIMALKTRVSHPDNKKQMDEEAGTFFNTATGEDEHYTDRFLRSERFTPEQLYVAVTDLMSRSETFRTKLIGSYMSGSPMANVASDGSNGGTDDDESNTGEAHTNESNDESPDVTPESTTPTTTPNTTIEENEEDSEEKGFWSKFLGMLRK